MGKETVCVSIITPSYNQGMYLEETIKSVLNQTYRNVEYLIIDGGSLDNSVDIIKKYQDKIHYWTSETDEGQADAINKGLHRASGQMLCWVNSDDILYPDYVANRVKQFREYKNIDMIYGDIQQGSDLSTQRLHKGRRTSIKNMLKYLECPIPQQSAMWRRDVLRKAGFLEKQWYALLDREYFIRIATKCQIKYIPGAVAFFRNHKLSKSVSDKLKWAEELPVYYETVFNDNKYNLAPKLLSYRERGLFNVYLKCAKIYSKANYHDEAEKYLARLKKLNFYRYIYNRYIKKVF